MEADDGLVLPLLRPEIAESPAVALVSPTCSVPASHRTCWGVIAECATPYRLHPAVVGYADLVALLEVEERREEIAA